MIKPLHDNVVVRRVEDSVKSAGGILLPGSAGEKPSQGEVIATGPGTTTDSGLYRTLTVKVGDMVLFGNSVSTVKVDGEELLIMKESSIYGILN